MAPKGVRDARDVEGRMDDAIRSAASARQHERRRPVGNADALQTHDLAADSEPEDAADTYAQERPADSPGMPDDPEPRDGEVF